MKYILQIDGGGIRGTIPASLLTEIEKDYNIQCCKKFDLISGTSTGAILGSALAAGAPAGVCRDLYVEKGAQLFQARSKLLPWNWLRPKYDRQLILNELSQVYKTYMGNSRIPMVDCRTKYMCTSVSLVDERTHFFKSWEEADAHRELLKTVSYSFAAAYYFGAIAAPEERQVWADGGEGQDNCTLRQCLIEALRQKWLPAEPVKILSLGCGFVKVGMSYNEAASSGTIGQAKFYLGLAERQSTEDQLQEAKEIGALVPLQVLRIDTVMPDRYNELDAIQFNNWFAAQGRNLNAMYRTQLTDFFKE